MKQIIILMLILGAFQVSAKDELVTKAQSKIDDVTIFLSGAQIQRSGSFYVQPGVSVIAFENVSAYIDGNTLQARGVGDFTIMDVVFETHYPKPDNANPNQNEMPLDVKRKLERLSDSIEDISYQLDELAAIKEVYSLERNMLLSNGTVKGTGKVNDSIPLLKEAMAFFHQKMTQINMELFKLKIKENKLNQTKTAMNGRYADLQNWRLHNNMVINKTNGPIYRLLVTVSAEKAVRGKLEVAYIVSQAGWKPSYDLRAKNANSAIELNYKAEVYQQTGIDWNKVPLTLSTSNPYARQQKPELATWYISYYDPVQYKQKMDLYDAKISMQRAEDKEMSDDSRFAYGGLTDMQNRLAENANAQSAYDHTVVNNNMVSAEYKINLPYSVKSNNKPHIVAVTKKNLDASYALALVPKLDKNAFLIASVTNWEDLNLIPAKARIYYDGTFVGHSYIDPTLMEDTLKLAMGRDASVSAVRKKLQDKTKEKVIGDNKVRETYFEIVVKNTHGYSIDLILEDQFPISNNQDIKVDLLEFGKADVNEYTGMLTWRYKLRAGGSQKVEFGYSVKYDKNKNLSMVN